MNPRQELIAQIGIKIDRRTPLARVLKANDVYDFTFPLPLEAFSIFQPGISTFSNLRIDATICVNGGETPGVRSIIVTSAVEDNPRLVLLHHRLDLINGVGEWYISSDKYTKILNQNAEGMDFLKNFLTRHKPQAKTKDLAKMSTILDLITPSQAGKGLLLIAGGIS